MVAIERGARHRVLAGIVLGLAALAPVGADAQTESRRALFTQPLFAPLPSVIDYARYYTRTEDCLAAVIRVGDSVHAGTARALKPAVEPTQLQALFTAADPRVPEPAIVGETALRCAARFSIAAAGPVDLGILEELYYAAPDSMIEAVLARRLALVPPDSAVASPIGKQSGRAGIVAEAIRFVLLTARPARVLLAERLLGDLERLGPPAFWARLTTYGWGMGFARAVNDTASLDRYLQAIAVSTDSLAAMLPQTEEATAELLFGLHSSLLELRREQAESRGEVVEPLAVYFARRAAAEAGKELDPADSARAAAVRPLAPPIQADFWFRRADSAAARPTRGKVGLVVSVDATEDYRSAWPRYAVIQDLHKRFGGELEITLVTRTSGYFRNYPVPTPAQEAEHIRHYFFEHLQLPGALAVEVIKRTRRPAPDRRFDGEPSVNATAPELKGLSSTYLVDRDGQVLLLPKLALEERHSLQAIIARILARED